MPKEYTPASLLPCEHFDGIDGEGNPIPVPCPGFCPKLVIKSWAPEGHPLLGPIDGDGKSIVHAVLFTAGELRRLIKEADEGYFDLPDMPLRKDSRFWSPLMQMLMEALETNPVRALGILLFLGGPQAVAYVSEPEPILALLDGEGEWLWIHLNGPAAQETPVLTPAEDAPADDAEVLELPQTVAYKTEPPAGATMLWSRPTPETTEDDRYDITDNGNAALNP